jgi:hypothetical protein
MPDKEVVFELTANTVEVSATLPSGRTLVLKKGQKRATSDPEEIAIWRGATGVQQAKAKKATKPASASKSSAPAAAGSTEGK